jgi:hypothetical protein
MTPARRLLAAAVACVAAAFLLLLPSRADAYAWMIRHDYAGCNICHADPSGGGLLTQYGRAQGELLLRTRYGSKAKEEEAGKAAGFLFGAFELPDALLLGGDLRALELFSIPQQGQVKSQFVWMQSDVEGQITGGRLRLNGSVGYSDQGALPAAITHDPKRNLVSRVHWAGVTLGEDESFMLRFGRMNLPFGLRVVEHTFAVRQASRTDINDQQQHGLAFSYNGTKLRGELMGVVGNLQMHPDAYRSRGGVGYLEYLPVDRLALGVSSLVLHAVQDAALYGPAWRQAHALTVRYSPAMPVVLMAEGDLLFQSQPNGVNDTGYASVLQADFEVVQGLHLIASGEATNATPKDTNAMFLGWGSVNWFFAPHADVRLDAIETSSRPAQVRVSSTSLVAQLHLFL